MARVLSRSGQQALWLIISGLVHQATGTGQGQDFFVEAKDKHFSSQDLFLKTNAKAT